VTEITYLDVGRELAVPHRLINPEIVSYTLEKSIVENGKRVIKRTKMEYTVVTAERVK